MQDPTTPFKQLPQSYRVPYTSSPVALDGTLSDPAWAKARWTEDFGDIEGELKPKPRLKTRAKMLWDKDYLYIGAEMEEPDLWATLTERDSVIFHDNDFEVFLDPNNFGAPYVEIEVNALNTVWDLLLVRPYRGGGPPLTGWDVKGLKTAVHLNGALNDPSKPSKGWTVEIAIPWSGIKEVCQVPCPPMPGDEWRINFSRVEWHLDAINGQYHKRPGLPEDNWVWSPMGVVNMHIPERWGVIKFESETSGDETPFLPDGWREKLDLAEVWIKQMDHHQKSGMFTSDPAVLDILSSRIIVYPAPDRFEIRGDIWSVDQSLTFFKVKE